MKSRLIDVAGRHQIRVYEGGRGPQLLFMHGAGGLLANDPFLARLEQKYYRVRAPLLPGYEDSDSTEQLRTMLDFTLFGLDVWEALGLKDPIARRPLDGRHDRGGDGGAFEHDGRAARADLSGRLVARRTIRSRICFRSCRSNCRRCCFTNPPSTRRCCRPAAISTIRSF